MQPRDMELPPPNTQDVSFTSLHPLPARLIPPLRRPPDAVPSSLQVVESYFGAELSSKMVDVANRLSERQLIELEIKLGQEQQKTQSALSLEDRPRQKPEFKKSSWLSRNRQEVFDPGTIAFFREVYSKMSWVQRPHISGANEISIHEDALPPDPTDLTEAQDIEQIGVLKHLALYSEHTAIRDPFGQRYHVAYGEGSSYSISARRRRLTNGLRQLLPIAPLVRDGTFILVEEASTPAVFGEGPDKTDPFLSWILERHRPDLQQEIARQRQELGIDRHDQAQRLAAYHRLQALDLEAQATVRQYYPYELSDQAWDQLMAMVRWTSHFSLTPVTTNPMIVRHMVQGARLALGERPDLSIVTPQLSPQSAAVKYRIPSLDHCLFPNIARLRGSSLFKGVRDGLLQVATVCAQSNPQSYGEYQQTIAGCAEDIVGPLCRKIEKRCRRGRGLSLGAAATGELVDMQLSGIAGKLAGAAINRLGGHIPRRRLEEAEIAYGVLRSVLLYKRGY